MVPKTKKKNFENPIYIKKRFKFELPTIFGKIFMI